ncbi:small-subunit processome [Linderina pennispora]|uniref:Small-subunit processome n=2 Tax=Linderina pennispora TaxID=61395 RepID=A0A1Y1WHM3_9FUNG|nr:small-subunit processome [Linderina pennispora]ORX73013.1 small-subunit processome [Linderina pennispora]
MGGQRKAMNRRGKKSDLPQSSYDVFEASDNSEAEQLTNRRQLERVDVRDYEVDEIDSSDDEDIDSDGAFDESDEEQFGSYKTKTAKGTTDEDRDMSDVEEMDEDFEGLVDLSEMLDGGAESDEEPASSKPRQDDDMSDDVLDQIDSESDSEMSEEDEDSKLSKLSKLDGFVTSISARAPKRRFVSETGDSRAEDEHAIGSGLSTKGVSLGIDDLLGSFATPDSEDEEGGEGKAAKEIRVLRDKVARLDKAANKRGSGVVAAPLAKRLQDQVDRKVAYAKTKKSISEWQPTVDANRSAEHLSFPLNAPSAPVVNSTALVATGHSKTDMEMQISQMLADSGMTDEQQQQYEELELKKLSPEEVKARRRELRLMRELMLIGGILKKDKLKAKDQALEQMREDDPEMYAMIMERQARSRAEERMSLRHKNTGKWAKAAAKHAHGNDDVRKALQEQLDQHESLKRKIYDLDNDEDVSDYEQRQAAGMDDDEGASDFSDNDGTFSQIKDKAMKELSKVIEGDSEEAQPRKGLFAMKFMQNAMERERQQAERDARAIRDEFESLEADVDEDGQAIKLHKNAPDDQNSVEEEDVKRVRLNSAGQNMTIGDKTTAADTSNPWLADEDAHGASNRSGKMAGLSRDSTKLDKLSARLRAKRQAVKSAGGSDDVLLDDEDPEGIRLESVDDSKKPAVFSQRELVEQAFAEDDVVAEEFEQEKIEAMEEDAPKDEVISMPGWGSWGGTRTKSRKITRPAAKDSGIEKDKRKDAKLGKVIINQKLAKASTKYYADNQFEETLQAPLGREWNTTRSHSKMVKPRVMTKMGKIIDPIMIPSKKRQVAV